MKIKISDLNGAQLDWAVAKCEGLKEEDFVETDNLYGPKWSGPEYSIDWAQGGPIIEREGLDILFQEKDRWLAVGFGMNEAQGPTPLIAAMRCYVGSKLGNEIEIPIELESCVS
jgi:hypothetical protein